MAICQPSIRKAYHNLFFIGVAVSFSSGTFSLVSGNPVVTGTTISSTWANNTLSDIATGLSTCILKNGTQTLTADIPFAGFGATNVRIRAIDGLVGTPGMTFDLDTDNGFYRIGTNNVGFSLGGTKLIDFSAALVSVTGNVQANSTTNAQLVASLTGTAASVIGFNHTGGAYNGAPNDHAYFGLTQNFSIAFIANGAFMAGFLAGSPITGGATTLSVDANGYIIRTPSDERVKTNIHELKDGIEAVRLVPAITYEFTGAMKKSFPGRYPGWGAQTVQEHIPGVDIVSGTDTLSLNEPKMAAILWSAVRNIDQRLSRRGI